MSKTLPTLAKKTVPTLAKKAVCETVGALLLGIEIGKKLGKTIKG